MGVRGIDFDAISTIFSIRFGNYSESLVFFFYILLSEYLCWDKKKTSSAKYVNKFVNIVRLQQMVVISFILMWSFWSYGEAVDQVDMTNTCSVKCWNAYAKCHRMYKCSERTTPGEVERCALYCRSQHVVQLISWFILLYMSFVVRLISWFYGINKNHYKIWIHSIFSCWRMLPYAYIDNIERHI
jgi:hypothetical protein